MTRDLLEQYDKVLERLEHIEGATKEMVFVVLNIDEKEEIERLLRMSDKELIDYLIKLNTNAQNENYLS